MVNRIAICDDVEVERFVLKRQLMVYFQTNGREAQIQENMNLERASLQTLKRAIYGQI